MNNRKNILSPSILAADFAKLGKEIEETNRGGAEYLHFDVMDGVFVPSISFGMPVLQSVRKITKQVLDVHLMITEPERYVEEFARCGADIITVHFETLKYPEKVLKQIRDLGVKVGLSVNPETSIHAVEPYLDMVDMVLVMTVRPGFGGQKYIDYCTDKVKYLRGIIDEKGYNVDIEVDGGINKTNLKMILEAGANVIVMGSAVFGENTYENTVQFNEILKA